MSNNSATVPCLMKSLSCLSFLAFVVVAACGGGQTTTNTSNNPPSGEDAAAPVATTDTSKDAGATSTGPTMESQRGPFVQACMRRMPAQAYCSCAFDQFADVFKGADL